MRSRSASAAALYQSCRVAVPVSLPIARVSLARIALLISASASSSTGACSGGDLVGCGSGKFKSPGHCACKESYADCGGIETPRGSLCALQFNANLCKGGPEAAKMNAATAPD